MRSPLLCGTDCSGLICAPTRSAKTWRLHLSQLGTGRAPVTPKPGALDHSDHHAAMSHATDDPADTPSADAAENDADLAAAFYRDAYAQVFGDSGITGLSYRLTHRALEWGVTSSGARILEIGAGHGQHLSYVDDDFAEYVMLDPLGPPLDWRADADRRISWVTSRAEEWDGNLGRFDRVVVTCVLHHVTDVAAVLRNVRRWLVPGGRFSLFLPSDPGFLNRVNRKLFVTPKARRVGFDRYPVFNAREHHNHYWSIRTELLHQFGDCRISRRYYPFGIPVADCSLFSVWQITIPDRPSQAD